MIHENHTLKHERKTKPDWLVGYAYVETRLNEYRATTLHDAMVMWCSARVRYSNRDDSMVMRVGSVG